MIRRWLAGLGFTALTLGSALAADAPPGRYMPPPRAPAYVPFFSWTGLYIGANGGYGFGKSRWTDSVTGFTTGDFDVSGWLAGGTLGYNMQMGSAVVGLEADFDWSNIKGSTTACGTTCETANQWLGTGRARIGYAFDRFMPYITGGVAFGRVKATMTGLGSHASNQIGWTAGGGIEYAFVSNWTAKAEYLYVDLGKVTCDAVCSGGNPFDVTFMSHIVRGGINYKF
jgi:outer membrane immunogenic protein